YAGELDSLAVGERGGSIHLPEQLHGEIFICIDDAVKQARQFRTTWQSELVRYLTHGVLHAVGYDDLTPADRCVMKREENRLLGMLSRQFRSEEHTSELQSRGHLVCRLLLEKKKLTKITQVMLPGVVIRVVSMVVTGAWVGRGLQQGMHRHSSSRRPLWRGCGIGPRAPTLAS